MEVKDFSEDITIASERTSKGRPVRKSLLYITMIGRAIASTTTTLGYVGNPLYHLSGLIPYALRFAVDYYETGKIINLCKDPRLKEYGLEKTVVEENPLQPKDLSKVDLHSKKFLSVQIAIGLFSTIAPPGGHCHGAIIPLIYKNHRALFNRIKKELDIGDEVKKEIGQGLSKQEIMKNLESMLF